ncbi:hypothetical protein [uncultured Salinibacterium sp.]|uniref:hypothetical protein n=1 Tax=uncultured Salinibacterium sp. TaxID=459274 RepID=UPI0030DC81F5
MAMYPTPPGESLEPIVQKIRDVERKVQELARPSGTNIASLVDQVQAALADLSATVIAETSSYLSSGTVNMANISASGSISASGNVTSSGTISAASALKSSGAATTNLGSVPGNRQAVWQIYDGSNVGLYGYAPSSITTKTNLEQVPYSAESFLRCAAYLYEYKDQVAMRDDPDSEYYNPAYDIPQEVGYMAEHLIENGLKQFVTIRDEQPIGIDYAAFGAVGMTVIGRAHERELAQINSRLETLESTLASLNTSPTNNSPEETK